MSINGRGFSDRKPIRAILRARILRGVHEFPNGSLQSVGDLRHHVHGGVRPPVLDVAEVVAVDADHEREPLDADAACAPRDPHLRPDGFSVLVRFHGNRLLLCRPKNAYYSRRY